MKSAGKLLSLLAVALLIGFVYIKTRPKPVTHLGSVSLSDGRILTLEKITFGKSHGFSLESEWVQSLRKKLSWSLGRRIFGPEKFNSTYTTAGDQLVFWLTCFDPQTKRYSGESPVSRCELIDSHGCIFPIYSQGSLGSQEINLHTWTLYTFPRRDERLQFIARGEDNEKLAAFSLTNPAVTNFPVWNPQTLPISITNLGFEFVLKSMTIERSSERPCQPWPKFETLKNGVKQKDWDSPRLDYKDATGNQGYTLCPFEPSWKLQARFTRSVAAHFDESNIWRFEDLASPSNAVAAPINQAADLQGLSIHLLYLTGAGSYTFSNRLCIVSNAISRSGGESMSSSSSSANGIDVHLLEIKTQKSFLLCSVKGLSNSKDLLVRCEPDEGPPLKCSYRMGSGDLMCYELPLPKDASRYDLEFIVQTPLQVEYIIDPRNYLEKPRK